MTTRWELRPGVFKPVDAHPVLMIVDHEDVKIFEICFDSKYPGQIWIDQDDDSITFTITPMDHGSQWLDKTAEENTKFIVFDVGMEWRGLVDGSRYTVQVVIYRRVVDPVMPSLEEIPSWPM